MGFPFEKAVDSKLQGQMPGVGMIFFYGLMGIVHGCHGKMILSATNIFVLFDLPSGYD